MVQTRSRTAGADPWRPGDPNPTSEEVTGMQVLSRSMPFVSVLLMVPVAAAAFGSFKANRTVWDRQLSECHAGECDGNHQQWLLPILDTSEGIFCYRRGDRSYWPPGLCMACGQTLDAWLLNLFWDHVTPSGQWYHFWYWGNMDKVKNPVQGARQEWLIEYRPEVCPGRHGAYVVGVDHRWRSFVPQVSFTAPKMSFDPVLQETVNEVAPQLGRQWDELGRWARRIIVFAEVYERYAGVPPVAVAPAGAELPPGSTVLDYWDRAYSLACQFWIYEPGSDGENTLERDRPEMVAQARLVTGIPAPTALDVSDMQDIIDETYALFGEVLTPVVPTTWGAIKASYRRDGEGRR
jgi:hypothetical protein